MDNPPEQASVVTSGTPPRRWVRFVPLLVLGLALALAIVLRVDRLIDFDALALRYGQFESFVASNPVLAGLAGIGIYVAVTALSIPGAWLLTVAMGLVFGWLWGGILVVIGATIGASILFFAARTALADFFRARAGGWLRRFAEGLKGDAASYLLFLRLAPIFPFTLLNILPGILGIPYRTFAWTTAIGIIPGTLAYGFAGEGLRSIIGDRAEACRADVAPCGTGLDAGELLTPQILIAFFLLAVVSLLPIVLKRWAARRNGTAPHSQDPIG